MHSDDRLPELDSEPYRAPAVAPLVILTGLVVAVLYAVADRLVEDVFEIEAAWGQLGEIIGTAIVTSVTLWVGVLRRLRTDAMRQHQVAEAGRRSLEEHIHQQAFESRLHRGLEMAATEEQVHRTVAKALTLGSDGSTTELLLADSSESHLTFVLSSDEAAAPRCGVVEPRDCPAIRRSQTHRYSSSTAIDACPQLDGRPSGPCSAVCVPISVGGRSIGVLHDVGPDGDVRTPSHVSRLEAVASLAGARIGLLRVMSATTLQATTDSLTGLANRRAFENRMRSVLQGPGSVAVAMADLDHFKRLNDTHGHDAGDRALRLFAHVLRSTLRSSDIACRHGGEEFVIAFPNLDADGAVEVLTRLRENLVVALADGTVPPFTASFGVVDTKIDRDLEGLFLAADRALFDAKRAGRDRVVRGEGAPTQPSTPFVDRPSDVPAGSSTAGDPI